MMITDYRSGHVGMQLAQFVQKGIVGRHRVEFPHVLVHYGVEFGVGMVGHLLVLVLFLLVVLRFRFEHIWVDLSRIFMHGHLVLIGIFRILDALRTVLLVI